MSVINQMLRELDARGGAAAGVSVVPMRPAAGRRPAPRVLGSVALAAAGVAAAYWLMPNVPAAKAPQDVPAIARQERKAPNLDRLSPPAKSVGAAPTLRSEPPLAPHAAPLLMRASASPEAALHRAAVALQQPRESEPAREPLRGPLEPALQAPESSVSFLALDKDTPEAVPAVVKKMAVLSPEVEARQHYDDAQALQRAEKYDAAIGEYRQALERNPAMADARIRLAGLLRKKGQAEAALALLQAGFEQRADDGLAIAAGRLLADLGQREAALDWLQRGATSLRPADHALMGALLSQAHRPEAAAQAYQRALAADPGQGGWLLGLGLAMEAQGRLDDARVAYRKALERGRFDPEVTRFLRERSGGLEP